MLSWVTSSRINSFSLRKQLFFGKISEMSNVEKFHSASELQHEPANFKHLCSTNQRISTYSQHKPASFNFICSANQQISNLFAVQTSEFQTYLQHEPANFKLICSTNRRISNLFAVQTSKFKLTCSTKQRISNLFAAQTREQFQFYLQYIARQHSLLIIKNYCTMIIKRGFR